MDAILEYFLRSTPVERWIIFVELVLIGVVVYYAVSFLEGTRGERLFRGVVLLLVIGSFVLNLIARNFGLERVEYLYKGFVLGILIIAVVAFQPEIRRLLIRIGQTSFFSGSKQQLTRSVEEIINAVTQMSGTKTGAIIVFEREVGLGEFIETGVRIDAKVTAELLKTIFYPGTPLHDMAVVIRGDRIVAARAQLPLAEGDSFAGRQLGSRHRAAVGVTLGSDAVVIVVSEETGTVSIAVNGELNRNVSDVQLRRALTSAVVETTPKIETVPTESETKTEPPSGTES